LFSVPRPENEKSLCASDMKLIKMEDPLEMIEDVPQPQDIEMPKCMDTERIIIIGQKLTDDDINYAQGSTVSTVKASQRQLDSSYPLPSKRPLDPCNNYWM